ncbi:MAG: response regulator [Candidatus Sericytochromatia bacterium]|nr:response regulator [Candidatus Sericytochromatia bacterium]
MNPTTQLHLLLIDDSDDDAAHIVGALRRGSYEPVWTRVDSAESMRAALARQRWDVLISDHQFPGFGSVEALAVMQETGLDLPFFLVSGAISDTEGAAAMRAGAHDYLSKDNLVRLVPAIERARQAIRRRQGPHDASPTLRASEGRFRRMTELAPAGIGIVCQGRFSYINPALADILGCQRQDDMPVAGLPGSVGIDLTALARSVGEAGRDAPAEIRFQASDRRRTVLEAAVVTLEDDDGGPATLCYIRDITERLATETQLRQADRMASVGSVATGVAHEINNPLAFILLNLDHIADDLGSLLKRGMENGGRHQGPADDALCERLSAWTEAVREARQGAARVRDIVQDLQRLARDDSDDQRPVDVGRLLDWAASMARNEIRQRARLTRAYGQVPAVRAAESRLSQVFLNLLINAAQAIPEGAADSHEIHISTGLHPDGRVAVAIRDTGSGIPSGNLDYLFDPFFTTKPSAVGTGLGLSICQNIVTALGGEILVHSEPGVGSTFTVLLPAAGSAIPVSPAPDTGSPAPTRRRLLVIDDEATLGRALTRALASTHEVEVHTDARTALDALMSGARYDRILCDLMMPVMSGMDFHAEICHLLPTLADTIIFCTGGAFTPGAEAFLARIPNPRLEKPFALVVLRELLDAPAIALAG